MLGPNVIHDGKETEELYHVPASFTETDGVFIS